MTIRARLRAMPEAITDGLRACQIDAIAGVEGSMAANHARALVQMATGAGKTFTACTLSYRLLAHAGFRRILFLADRANLVRQKRDEFLPFRPPGTGRSRATAIRGMSASSRNRGISTRFRLFFAAPVQARLELRLLANRRFLQRCAGHVPILF